MRPGRIPINVQGRIIYVPSALLMNQMKIHGIRPCAYFCECQRNYRSEKLKNNAIIVVLPASDLDNTRFAIYIEYFQPRFSLYSSEQLVTQEEELTKVIVRRRDHQD